MHKGGGVVDIPHSEVPYPGSSILPSRVHELAVFIEPHSSYVLGDPFKYIHLQQRGKGGGTERDLVVEQRKRCTTDRRWLRRVDVVHSDLLIS